MYSGPPSQAGGGPNPEPSGATKSVPAAEMVWRHMRSRGSNAKRWQPSPMSRHSSAHAAASKLMKLVTSSESRSKARSLSASKCSAASSSHRRDEVVDVDVDVERDVDVELEADVVVVVLEDVVVLVHDTTLSKK